MSQIEMPMEQQMELNIEKRRIDKKVRLMEMEGEERKKAFHDNKKIKVQIKKRAKDLYNKYKSTKKPE